MSNQKSYVKVWFLGFLISVGITFLVLALISFAYENSLLSVVFLLFTGFAAVVVIRKKLIDELLSKLARANRIGIKTIGLNLLLLFLLFVRLIEVNSLGQLSFLFRFFSLEMGILIYGVLSLFISTIIDIGFAVENKKRKLVK